MKEAVALLVTSAYLPSISVGVAAPVKGGGDEVEAGDDAADVEVVDSF